MSASCKLRESFPRGLKGLIFDVDGVLFDSRDSNIEFYNLIRRALHLPSLTADEEDFCHMATSEEIFACTIPPELHHNAVAAAKNINYKEIIQPLLKPEEGLLEALHWLHNWNVPMAICTNRTNSVDSLLRAFGLESFFPIVKTAQNSLPKPHPQGLLNILAEWGIDHCEAAFLGDSKVDEQAARSAFIPFWSFRNSALLADLHFPGFFEMITWIAPLVEGRK